MTDLFADKAAEWDVRPLPQQFADYLGKLAQGDFGRSIHSHAEISGLLAERLPATEASEHGLVSSVHPAGELDAAVAAVIGRLAAGPAVALRKTKHAINAATLTELDGALARETAGQLTLLGNKDFAEGTRAFQERREPGFTDE